MVIDYYLHGLFSLATLFIAFFITAYSYLFLKKTERQRERLPWDFLFVSSIFFSVFQFFSLLMFFGLLSMGGVDILLLSKIFEFLYSGLVLLAFVSQHDLILKSHLILITKKEDDDGVEFNVKFERKETKKKKKKS
jgi:amino acid transporter